MAIQQLRSSTANKRPDPVSMVNGQIALNIADTSPGLFFKNAGGTLVKAGPVHVGSNAPNSSAAGTTGNAVGELWLDSSVTPSVLRTWDGSVWQSLFNSAGDTIRVGTSKTPASATDTGNTGEICWDSSYIYVCVATNTWVRAALSTW
jgi:hypothetical protein